MKKAVQGLTWLAIAALGAWAYAVLAWQRGEPLNSAYLLVAALCSYAIGYRFYSKWIAARVLALNERRATPCEVHDDGKDFVRTNQWIVFGHHFAAISGPGPLVGPVLAAQFGYLPGILWILIGVVLGGAVQDFVILFCSLRRDGKSLGQMVKEELNTTAGAVAVLAILGIMTILLAVLALVVVRALAESPWGVFTVGATIPIALLMGGYLRCLRIGKVLEATSMGIGLLLLAVWGGKLVYGSPEWSRVFSLEASTLAWLIIGYGLAASILPVWLLLAPRDYLSTFMKLGTILALALGILLVLPNLQMPALSRFIDGSGPVVPGKLFPFCFITIACGAISGFHALISSGTTPKLITRETHARPVGYGAMCCESLVATMALIAACTLEPGVYLSVNMKGAPEPVVQQVNGYGFAVTTADMDQLAHTIGEKTLFGRTGGAATLAVGMARIFARFVGGHGLDIWYHFAIMFEALFILTTLDAGTRVGRYLLQDALGHIWKPLGETRRLGANLLASGLVVGGWGYFLIQGVRDPLGGVSSLWHLFGIANQLLSVIALSLATTVILKMQLTPPRLGQSDETRPKVGRPRFAWITLVPLLWLLAVTTSAGWEKLFSPNPQIGFLAKVEQLQAQLPALEAARSAAEHQGDDAARALTRKAVRENLDWQFNWRLDAAVAAAFMILVVLIVLLSAREWILLLARRRLAALHESEPVWLPAGVFVAEKPVRAWALFALAFALVRELAGDAQMERMRQRAAMSSPCGQAQEAKAEADTARRQAQAIYLRVTEQRFNGIRRCC